MLCLLELVDVELNFLKMSIQQKLLCTMIRVSYNLLGDFQENFRRWSSPITAKKEQLYILKNSSRNETVVESIVRLFICVV